jgi:hypothetical protein
MLDIGDGGGIGRPFLIVRLGPTLVEGWLFPCPSTDATSGFLKQHVPNPADRGKPCYLTVPVADLQRP